VLKAVTMALLWTEVAEGLRQAAIRADFQHAMIVRVGHSDHDS
jgi:hypothetical protein